MAFSVALFRINISNTYYQDGGIGNDFSIVPSEESQQWMEKWKLRVVSYPTYLEVIWLTANIDAPLGVFKEKLANTSLSFYMVIQNPNLVNFSSLDVGGDQIGKCYYFCNKLNTNKLHAGTYVSTKDLVPQKQLMHCPVPLGKNILGVIVIDLRVLMRVKDFLKGDLPVCYTLAIKARETIWRYIVVDVNKKVELPMKVILGNNKTCFTEVVSDGIAHMYTYESVQPIALSNKAEKFFSLETYMTGLNGVTSKIVVKRLPLPPLNSLRKGGSNKKNLYSDIVVYV